jgi:hypothetical protein
VPTVFLQHTRVSSGGLAREQENPEVREGVGIATKSGPIGFFLESTTSSSSYPSPLVNSLIEPLRIPSLNSLIEPLRIPSLKHRHHGKADYRCHGSL